MKKCMQYIIRTFVLVGIVHYILHITYIYIEYSVVIPFYPFYTISLEYSIPHMKHMQLNTNHIRVAPTDSKWLIDTRGVVCHFASFYSYLAIYPFYIPTNVFGVLGAILGIPTGMYNIYIYIQTHILSYYIYTYVVYIASYHIIWYHIIFPMQCTHDEAHPDDCFLTHRSWSPKPGATTPVEEPTMDMTWVCHGQWLMFPMIFSMFVDFHGCSCFVDFSINEFTARCIQWVSHGLFRYVFFLVTGEQLFSCVKPTHCATFSIYLPDLTRSYQILPDLTTHIFLANSFGQWIGLRENLQERPIFNRKIYGFL